MKSQIMAALLAALMGAAAPEAASAQAKPGATGARPTVDLRVCNNSGRGASVAVSYVQPGENSFINRGWYEVASGTCEAIVTTDNQNFYFYADTLDGSGRRWQGSHTLCVEYPGPYTFYSTGASECEYGQELRGFLPFRAEEPGAWTWTLDP